MRRALMVSIPGGDRRCIREMAEGDRRGARCPGRSTSTSAPTPCCWKSSSIDSNPRNTSRSPSISSGPREEHDVAVCREGTYDIAVKAIRAAIAKGFRVTANSTLFNNAEPARGFGRCLSTMMTDLGVEGMMLPRLPVREGRRTRSIFSSGGRRDRPVPADLREAEVAVDVQPVAAVHGVPGRGTGSSSARRGGTRRTTFCGWQKPCYLISDGYAQTFRELMETTDWNAYGRKSGNSRCQDCMVHCGHEPTAVQETFSSLKGLFGAPIVLFGPLKGKPLPGFRRSRCRGWQAT